jgi:hypothetical protein
MTLHAKPPNATHWSLRSMAAAAGVSYSSVQRIWRAHGLKPHPVETFKVSRDKNFAAKAEDVVGLYLDPPDRAPLLRRRKEPNPSPRPHPTRIAHEEGACRYHDPRLQARRHHLPVRSAEHAVRFLRLIDQQTPAVLDLHLIVDNHATYRTPAVKRWLKAHPPLPFALHADFGFLAQHGRAVPPRSPENVFAAAPSRVSRSSKAPS